MRSTPDLVALRMLGAVADAGSLSAAGAALGVTQQAVSARMRRLESDLGVALLVRTPAGTTLTTAGTVVAGWAADVAAAADRLVDGVDALRAGADRGLTVASSLTIAEHLLPRWLIALRADPATASARIAVSAVNSRAVIDAVRAGEHPLGFIETPDAAPGLRTLRVARDELVVVVAPSHPWARRRRGVSAAQLAATPLVTREPGSGTRLSAERVLRAAAGELAPSAAELPTASGIRTTVAAGVAPAVLSILAVRDDLASGRLVRVPLSDARIVRDLRAVMPGPLPPALDALLRIARRT
ncbi:LysR family transcriptional regulator [Leifsonia poae]|uniref:LysR family transcriptional regulator n=1 Tax=Leifsonia poae TaxID=110933 RepID=UPI001CBC00DF|nr:LysR family transcriptional regulator [Leifsonia poae]